MTIRRKLTLWYAGLLFVSLCLIAGVALPVTNEVPEQFPTDVLWQFRIASIGAQLLLWTTLGLGFRVAAERVALSTTYRYEMGSAGRW